MSDLTLEKGPIVGPSSQVQDRVSTAYNISIFALETTQRFWYEARYITWDGRIFKYGRSKGTLLSGFGATNAAAQNIGAVPPYAYAIGDRSVIVTIASGDGYAADGVVEENELSGGFFITGHDTEDVVQTRLIEANTAVLTGGGECTLKLDMPICKAVTTSSYNEVVLNPYAYLSPGAKNYEAVMCVATIGCTTGQNFWGQTWGPCFVVPGGSDATPGNTVNDRMAFFVGDGTVNFGTSVTIETGYQPAGFCIDQTSSALSAVPLIMLQIST